MQNATLAGGVSIGMSCSYNVEPWVPVLIGGLAGMLSSFGYGKIAECLEVITFIKLILGIRIVIISSFCLIVDL